VSIVWYVRSKTLVSFSSSNDSMGRVSEVSGNEIDMSVRGACKT